VDVRQKNLRTSTTVEAPVAVLGESVMGDMAWLGSIEPLVEGRLDIVCGGSHARTDRHPYLCATFEQRNQELACELCTGAPPAPDDIGEFEAAPWRAVCSRGRVARVSGRYEHSSWIKHRSAVCHEKETDLLTGGGHYEYD
jgi:hypothetical protein